MGFVKQALLQAIGKWTHQENMVDENADPATMDPDIDTMRHLNQFGTPVTPLIEIACITAKVEHVKKFFAEIDIHVWPDETNPLLAPDTPPTDSSAQADKRHFGNCVRVMVAWWKAAHYVQNQDTVDYCAIIIG